MKIRNTIRYYLSLVRISIIKKSTKNKCWRECGENGNPYNVSGNVNWYSHYGEQYEGSSEKLNIELLYDPVIPFLGIYPEKTIFWPKPNTDGKKGYVCKICGYVYEGSPLPEDFVCVTVSTHETGVLFPDDADAMGALAQVLLGNSKKPSDIRAVLENGVIQFQL